MNLELTEIWKIFKTGKSDIVQSIDTWFEVISGFNPYYARLIDRDGFENMIETVLFHNLSNHDRIDSEQEADNLFSELLAWGIWEEGQVLIENRDYKSMLGCIVSISCALYHFAPDYFFPYFYQYKFEVLEQTFDLLGLELPEIPKRTDWPARCRYYWEICKKVNEIRRIFNLAPDELSLFLYNFIPSISKIDKGNLPQPSQCWMIGGIIHPKELEVSTTIWQANIDTRKGDIMIHYETSPVSAITGIWIAEEDAIVDPLSNWYSNTFIGHRTVIPKISLKEIKDDAVLSRFPLSRKNFQGVNGFPVDSETYKRILGLLKNKGFDVSQLPKIYTPSLPNGILIELERDVEAKLLEPLLASLGLTEGRDYVRQLGIHVGSGHRVFPDYALHFNRQQETARIIIEAKLHMKSRADVETAFFQARSYALNLQSRTIVLCDKQRIIVYQNKNGAFNMINPIQFGWDEMGIPEKYNTLKKLLT